MLYDTIKITITSFIRVKLIPYQLSRGKSYLERRLPVKSGYSYSLTKLWNRDHNKAVKLYNLLKNSKRYDKVKLHKNCVYLSRRLPCGYCEMH